MEFVRQMSVYSVIEIPSTTPMGDKAMRDPIVEQVRRIREELPRISALMLTQSTLT
jgi:hypothetical protein